MVRAYGRPRTTLPSPKTPAGPGLALAEPELLVAAAPEVHGIQQPSMNGQQLAVGALERLDEPVLRSIPFEADCGGLDSLARVGHRRERGLDLLEPLCRAHDSVNWSFGTAK